MKDVCLLSKLLFLLSTYRFSRFEYARLKRRGKYFTYKGLNRSSPPPSKKKIKVVHHNIAKIYTNLLSKYSICFPRRMRAWDILTNILKMRHYWLNGVGSLRQIRIRDDNGPGLYQIRSPIRPSKLSTRSTRPLPPDLKLMIGPPIMLDEPTLSYPPLPDFVNDILLLDFFN
jgi:hypothetical protein